MESNNTPKRQCQDYGWRAVTPAEAVQGFVYCSCGKTPKVNANRENMAYVHPHNEPGGVAVKRTKPASKRSKSVTQLLAEMYLNSED